MIIRNVISNGLASLKVIMNLKVFYSHIFYAIHVFVDYLSFYIKLNYHGNQKIKNKF
jgi:hypothetical protein